MYVHGKAFFVRYPTGRHDYLSDADAIELDSVVSRLGYRVIKGRVPSYEQFFGYTSLVEFTFVSRGRAFVNTNTFERIIVIPSRERGYLLHVFCLEYPYVWRQSFIESVLEKSLLPLMDQKTGGNGVE